MRVIEKEIVADDVALSLYLDEPVRRALLAKKARVFEVEGTGTQFILIPNSGVARKVYHGDEVA